MAAGGNLTPWNKGDSFEHAHLNEAWKRLQQIGAIDGATQVGAGTTVYVPPQWFYFGQFDAKVQIHADLNDTNNSCYNGFDYPDPRYQVQAVRNHQYASTPQYITSPPPGSTLQSDDPLNIELSPFPGGMPPDRVVTAWNLWETEWNSHYILPGEIVTVHIIRQVVDQVSTGTKDFYWYVFNKAPKLRKGTVVDAYIRKSPTDCDNFVYVWDQKELVKFEHAGIQCLEITKVKLSSAALAGAWDFKPYDVIDYIPTGPVGVAVPPAYIPQVGTDSPNPMWTGDIVAWHPVLHVGEFGCLGQTIFDIAPVGGIQFFENDFLMQQADVHHTGCFDTVRVFWAGMMVTGGYGGGPFCNVKALGFTGFNQPNPGTDIPIDFTATQILVDRNAGNCGCPEGGDDEVVGVQISATVRIPVGLISSPTVLPHGTYGYPDATVWNRTLGTAVEFDPFWIGFDGGSGNFFMMTRTATYDSLGCLYSVSVEVQTTIGTNLCA